MEVSMELRNKLWEQCRPYVLATITRKWGRKAAEEMLGDAFIHFCKALDRYDPSKQRIEKFMGYQIKFALMKEQMMEGVVRPSTTIRKDYDKFKIETVQYICTISYQGASTPRTIDGATRKTMVKPGTDQCMDEHLVV